MLENRLNLQKICFRLGNADFLFSLKRLHTFIVVHVLFILYFVLSDNTNGQNPEFGVGGGFLTF